MVDSSQVPRTALSGGQASDARPHGRYSLRIGPGPKRGSSDSEAGWVFALIRTTFLFVLEGGAKRVGGDGWIDAAAGAGTADERLRELGEEGKKAETADWVTRGRELPERCDGRGSEMRDG